MTSKVFFTALVMLASHCVCGKSTVLLKNQELTEFKQEERTLLLEVPLIGTVLMVTFKLIDLLMNTVGPLFQYKLAAFALMNNVSSWLYQNYFVVIIGTVALLGYWVVPGVFTQQPEFVLDHRLLQAARQLEAGALKYARIIN